MATETISEDKTLIGHVAVLLYGCTMLMGSMTYLSAAYQPAERSRIGCRLPCSGLNQDMILMHCSLLNCIRHDCSLNLYVKYKTVTG